MFRKKRGKLPSELKGTQKLECEVKVLKEESYFPSKSATWEIVDVRVAKLNP